MSDGRPRIRVVVADDHELFLYGMRMLIESQDDLELVGTATHGQAAVALVADRQPDVVLLDIRMPVVNGIEVARRITAACPASAPRVIMLTTFRQEEAVLHAMRNGASAFVTKDVTPEVLFETIRSVHRGDAPALTVAGMAGRSGASAAAEVLAGVLTPLSPREREIFALVAKGLRNSEVAAAAFVSEATVKSHVRSILAKLGLRSRAQIVVFAYESGLLAP